ncbi:unnamed protein product [Polarella glacialis]|uniref:EF-hand domain-containing protein n=1 Tax=Polarella glacialis TaxID=89957 RepID=A0A813IKH4_POLGL|nr:unnamed protein product [Polarella glacialis]
MPMFNRKSFLSPSVAESIGKLHSQVTEGLDISYRDMMQTLIEEADKCMGSTGSKCTANAERCRTAPRSCSLSSQVRSLHGRVALSPLRRRRGQRGPCGGIFGAPASRTTTESLAPISAAPSRSPSKSSVSLQMSQPFSRPATPAGTPSTRRSTSSVSLQSREAKMLQPLSRPATPGSTLGRAAQVSLQPLPERVGTPTGAFAPTWDVRKQTPDSLEKLTQHSSKEAARLFLPHASLDGALSKQQFAKILLQLSGCESKDDLPDGMLEQAFRVIPGGKMTFGDFDAWFSRAGFDERLILTSEQRGFRQLCRNYGMNVLDVERYRQIFNEFDIDRSGAIEKNEFEALVRKCAKVRANVEIPSSRFQQLWKDCDLDGSGEVTFEEFLMFYRRYFDDSSGDNVGFEGFYRSLRPALGKM